MLIAVDLDGVLSNTLGGFIKFHNEAYGTTLVREDFYSEYYWEVLKEPKEVTTAKFDIFFKTHHFQNIQPILGAQETTVYLAKKHELVVLTARRLEFTDATKQWIEIHFPQTFKDVHVINHATLATSGKTMTKGEKCEELGIDLVIEDNIMHAMDCLRDTRNVLLLDQLWNQEELPNGIQRVASWDDIREHQFLL